MEKIVRDGYSINGQENKIRRVGMDYEQHFMIQQTNLNKN